MIDTLSVKPTIPVVEDERTQLALLTNKLVKCCYNVLCATHGIEGIEVWTTNKGI